MTDTSDQMPDGGYILPNFPLGYWRDNPNATLLFGLLDNLIDEEWGNIVSLDARYDAAHAVGDDLDDIGALVDVPRIGGEQDGPYRTRIEAATGYSDGASNNQQMAAYLGAMFGTIVTVDDLAPGTAAFNVTIQGVGSLSSGIPAIIRQIKAAGTVFSVLVIGESGAPNRLRDVRLGDAVVGRPRGGVTFGGS